MEYTDTEEFYMTGNYLGPNGPLDVQNVFKDAEKKHIKQYREAMSNQSLKGDKTMRAVFTEKIREFEAEIFDEQVYRRGVMVDNSVDKEWKLWIISRSQDREKELNKKLTKFKWLRNITADKDKGTKELNIIGAKEFPIGDLLTSLEVNKTSGRKTYACPLHNEKTGSFVWYIKTNKFHCFGCQANGDVIDLYMKLNNCDFKTAVNQLTR